jgi:uncharacterized surface anchored protein
MCCCPSPECSGGIQVTAISITDMVLPGATFAVYSGSQLVGTVVSDINGVADLANLCPGVYTISQLAAPAGYALSSLTPMVTVTNDNVSSVVAVYTPLLM